MENKRSIFMLLVLLLGFSSCDKSNQLCGGNDPANELSWLRNKIKDLEKLNSCNSISRTTFKDQPVFVFSTCDASVDSFPILYNCNGDQLSLSIYDYQQLKFNGTIEPIWKSR